MKRIQKIQAVERLRGVTLEPQYGIHGYSLQGPLQVDQPSEWSFMVFSTQKDLGSCYSLNIYAPPKIGTLKSNIQCDRKCLGHEECHTWLFL